MNYNRGRQNSRDDYSSDNNKPTFSFRVFIMRVIPNISIILSLITIVLLVLNVFNRIMNFVNNSISRGIFFALAISSLITSVLTIVYERILYKASLQNGKSDEKYDWHS